MRLPIAREGWPFILPLFGLAGVGLVTAPIMGLPLMVLAAFVAYFFRDPERATPSDPGLLLSPADGRVVTVTPPLNGAEQPAGTLVSIFLSVLDVHVNRAPVSGRVIDVRYQSGKFLPAFRDDASARNEQNIVTLQTGERLVIVRQIAGILARRIVCRVQAGDTLQAGERFGLIRFGSRVDVLIPPEFTVQTCVGQRVRGGQSVLAVHALQPVPQGASAAAQRQTPL